MVCVSGTCAVYPAQVKVTREAAVDLAARPPWSHLRPDGATCSPCMATVQPPPHGWGGGLSSSRPWASLCECV